MNIFEQDNDLSLYESFHQKRSLTIKEVNKILRKPNETDWKFLLRYRKLPKKVLELCPKINIIYEKIINQTITEDYIRKNIKLCRENCDIFHKIIKYVNPLTEDFIIENIQYIQPFDILDYKGRKLSEHFYDLNYDNFKDYLWELYDIRIFSDDFLLKHINDESVINKKSKTYLGINAWATIMFNQKLPNILLKRYEKYINWKDASLIQNISLSQYRKYYQMIDWDIISSRPDIPIDVLDEFAEFIKWKILLQKHTYVFDEQFIMKHGTKSYWNWDELLLSHNQPLSDNLIIWACENSDNYIHFDILSTRTLTDVIVDKYCNSLIWNILLDSTQKITANMLDKYSDMIDQMNLWNIALLFNKFKISTLERYMDKFTKEQLMILSKYQNLNNVFMTKYFSKLDLRMVLFRQKIDYNFIKEHNLDNFIKSTFDSVKISFYLKNFKKDDNFTDLCQTCNHYHRQGTKCKICNHVRKINDKFSNCCQNIDHNMDIILVVYIPDADYDIESCKYFKYLLFMNDTNGIPYFNYINSQNVKGTINMTYNNHKINYITTYVKNQKIINKKFEEMGNFINNIIQIQRWWIEIIYKPNGLMYQIYLQRNQHHYQ